jgi:CHAT domain
LNLSSHAKVHSTRIRNAGQQDHVRLIDGCHGQGSQHIAVADGRDPSDYTEVRGVCGTGPFAQFESAKLELAETLEDIKRVSLDDKLRFRFIPLSWTELLGDMTASRAVILFVEEPGAARLFAAVLTMDAARPKEGRPKIQFRELPTASYERLPALKEQLRNGLAAVIDVSGTLRDISDLLWVPLGDLPTDLTILLTPRLIGIPFESLFTADGKPVILRHTVRYAFGLQPGLARYPKLSSIRRAAVVGVEDFSSVNRPLLPSSRLEVEQLRELLRARGTAVLPKDAMPRSGKDLFTETKPLDVIHISTHSRLDRTIPLLDYLLFPQDKIFAHDLAVSDLRARLVVLSACELFTYRQSGLYPVSGIATITMGWIAPQVMSTLWSVNAEATQLFMQRFYAHLFETAEPAQALAAVKRDFINALPAGTDAERVSEYLHIAYWAPFVLTLGPMSAEDEK